jgi:hypothetical protein
MGGKRTLARAVQKGPQHSSARPLHRADCWRIYAEDDEGEHRKLIGITYLDAEFLAEPG